APGTRAPRVLPPRTLVERVHAIVLAGGAAFGLAAADGVMRALAADGIGFPVGARGGPRGVAPIAPSGILFDLGRGGEFGHAPDAALGAESLRAASLSVA